jgi:hypothetical protein
MSLVVDTHREFLKDSVRIDAFRRAIRQRVRPGDVVVDLGAGTGVLGLLACEAGAARVYAVEATGMIELARRIAAANAFADRIVPVQAMSDQVRLHEPVDGIVTDQIGHFGFEAGLFEMMSDARRFLAPRGWTVPAAVELHLAPIRDPEVRQRLDFWQAPVAGFDFSAAREWAVNTGYPKRIEPEQLLGPAAMVARVAMSDVSTDRLVLDATLTIDRSGTLDALGGWFTSELAPGVVVTNAPDADSRLDRRNVVLPLDRPVPVAAGDTVQVDVRVRPAERIVAWRGVVRGAAGVQTRFSQSTLGGMLLTREDVRRLKPATVPRLTERGLARRTVLELCDGRRPLDDIEREVLRRHPALFRSPAEAEVFVAEVVSRYTD